MPAAVSAASCAAYELSEFNLYTIEQELEERFAGLPLVKLIGNVKDLEHLRLTYGKWKPQVVFHAAVYKHVPLMDDENAWAALRNNTLGTYHAAPAAAEHGVERFVLTHPDIIRYFRTIPEVARWCDAPVRTCLRALLPEFTAN